MAYLRQVCLQHKPMCRLVVAYVWTGGDRELTRGSFQYFPKPLRHFCKIWQNHEVFRRLIPLASYRSDIWCLTSVAHLLTDCQIFAIWQFPIVIFFFAEIARDLRRDLSWDVETGDQVVITAPDGGCRQLLDCGDVRHTESAWLISVSRNTGRRWSHQRHGNLRVAYLTQFLFWMFENDHILG